MIENRSWYVVHSKLRKEYAVYRQLCAKSIEAYYPTLRVKPVNPRAAKIRPIFPRYLFVNTNFGEIGVNAIKWIPGVKHLLPQGGEPFPISDVVISELKRLISIIDKGCPLDTGTTQEGSLVQITDGPFAGNNVLFDLQISGLDRVMVILSVANGHSVK
jgi:transcription antitermination factor NusG